MIKGEFRGPKYRVGEIVWRIFHYDDDKEWGVSTDTITHIHIGLGKNNKKPKYIWYSTTREALTGHNIVGENSLYPNFYEAIEAIQKQNWASCRTTSMWKDI